MNNRAVLAYGMLGLPLAFAALPIYVHVPRFYAAGTGMSLALLGAILFGARVFDLAIDPWLGWLADRVDKTRMAALALLPLGGGFFALFHPPAQHAAPWLLGALSLTCFGYSAASVAYLALGAQRSTDSQLANRYTAAREGLALCGVMLAAVLPALLADDADQGVALLCWILPLLLLLAAPLSLRGSGARSSGQHQPLWSSLRIVLADRTLRRLLVVAIANGVASAVPATLFFFFVDDILQAPTRGGALLLLYFVSGAASLPLWLWLVRRIGRVRAWLGAMLLAMLAFAGAGLLGSGDAPGFAVICLASGLALGADLVVPAAIASDLGTRMKQSGAVFGIWTCVTKLNLALAAGLCLPLLALLGYVPGGVAGRSALLAGYALLPLLIKGCAACLLWHWRKSLEIEK
jgi:Na+/melibiose symporter-like transporter